MANEKPAVSKTTSTPKPRAPKKAAETKVSAKVVATEEKATHKPKVAPAKKAPVRATSKTTAAKTAQAKTTAKATPVKSASKTGAAKVAPKAAAKNATPEKVASDALVEVIEPDTAENDLRELFGDDIVIIPESLQDEIREEAEVRANEAYSASSFVEYTKNGVVLAPGYWQAWRGEGGRVNVLVWIGFIFAIPFFPLGLLLSYIGLLNAKDVPDDRFHKLLGIAGFALSAFMGFYLMFVFMVWVLSGAIHSPVVPMLY